MFQGFYKKRTGRQVLASLMAAVLIVSGSGMSPLSVVKAESVSSGDGQAVTDVTNDVPEAESGGGDFRCRSGSDRKSGSSPNDS